MIKLLSYLISKGVATARKICPPLDDACTGLPALTDSPCSGSPCNACKNVCPTAAIQVIGKASESIVVLDRGACIACGLCIETCPTGTIVRDLSTKVAVYKREDLVLSTDKLTSKQPEDRQFLSHKTIFDRALSIRVVSTGCAACDLEIGAAGNPVFDMDRFGAGVVASPRFADALVITGPVGKGMQNALLRCYEAMAEPRLVIAAGTCSISGGIHKGGYAEANGVDSLLPVNVYIPGCPPHPWSIIHGVSLAMGHRL